MKSDSCAKNGRFSQKPRPGLRGKTSRYRSALRIRDGQPGRLFGADDVSAARRIDQWFLRVGGSTGESAVEIRFVSDRQNSCDPPPLERSVRIADDSCGAQYHGIRVGCKRVARLMRTAHLQGVWPHRFVITTTRDDAAKQPIDLVDRGFYAEYPDRLWVADITYIPTWAGFLYLAAVLDVYSRKVVGWAMKNHLRTELVLEALQNAISQRRPQGVIHHSDRGCQYTSYAFGKRCQEAGVMPSMGSV